MRGEMGLTNAKRPRGSFLFVGPSGVGKTELTEVFSTYLHGENSIVRLDMSEFMLQESAGVMIGRNDSESGRLGKALAGKKHCTVLFDEIEKAHPLVLDLLLQILDAGRITLANNTRLDFTGMYIVLTSNIGSRDAMQMKHMAPTAFEKTILKKVRAEMRPEFFFRINTKQVFRPLEVETQELIADDLIKLSLERMRKLGYTLTMSDAGRLLIIDKGIDRESGARPLRGTCEDFIEGAIAEALLAGRDPNGDLVPSEDQEYLTIVGKNG
jgi:ATP-dependent Clp protease ATP-binding subunit ClpB